MEEMTVGIDVSKHHLDVAIRQQNKSIKHQRFAYTVKGQKQLLKWLEKSDALGSHVCMEATGRYSIEIATNLYHAQYAVSIESPYRTKHFAQSLMQRQKTDQVDASMLAHYAAIMPHRAWQPTPLNFKNAQELKRLYDDLQQDRTRTLNRLEGLRKASPARPYLEKQLQQIDKQLQQVEQDLATVIDDDPQLNQQLHLLTSIKGFGSISARQLLAEIADWTAFSSADQLVAYAGLCPQHFQSGQKTGYSRLSKRGNAHIRKLLYYPALSAMQHNPHLKVFAERLKANGKAKMQVVVAVMRKLLVLAYAILKSGQPYDLNYQFST